MKKNQKKAFGFQYGFAAVPVVLALIVVLLGLSIHSIYSMRENIVLSEEAASADAVDQWVERVKRELNIHRTNMEAFFSDREAMEDYLLSTYDVFEEYPMGIYMGDETGYYFDSSGWIAGDDFIVTERQWFLEGKDTYNFTFGTPYIDAFTGNICVSVSARMHDQDTVTVMAADLYTDYPEELVLNLKETSSLDAVMLVDGTEKTVVASSDKNLNGLILTDLEGSLYKKISGMLENGETSASGKNIIWITHAEASDWYVVGVMKRSAMLGPMLRFVPVVLLLGALAVALLIYLAGKYVESVSEMEEKAVKDQLTGLSNREGFRRNLEQSGETSFDGILILLDLDHFKNVNDSLGHPEGDAVLVMFSDLLKEFFNRNSDFTARLGGDEFAVTQEGDLDAETVRNMMDRFMKKAEMIFSSYQEYGLSVSAGVDFFHKGEEYETVYKRCDDLLYEAKNSGRAGYVMSKEDAS